MANRGFEAKELSQQFNPPLIPDFNVGRSRNLGRKPVERNLSWKRILFLVILGALLVILVGKVSRFISVQESVPAWMAVFYVYGISVSFVIFTTFFVAYLFYQDPYTRIAKHNPRALTPTPLISCMVAVFNEEVIIEQCIQSLINQTYKNKEIIFVNDHSQDGTAEVLDRYAATGLIKVIHLPENMGKKRALGQAMLQAKGSIFAFSDSDSIWAPDAIEKIVPIFNDDPTVGGVSGHCRALNADKSLFTRIQDSWYEGQFSVRKAFESVYGSVTCVSGPLAVFRRSAIYNYIPAWENDTFLGQEFKFATDRTLTGFVLGSKTVGLKIKAQYADSPFVHNEDHPAENWKIVYAKSARAWTEVPDTFRRVLKQQIRWKKSFIRNTFYTGAFYWQRPLLPALFYYLHILFVLVGPFISFTHLIWMPLSGNLLVPVLYLSGIFVIGAVFALSVLLEDSTSRTWVYRPLMSLFSTLVLSWLIYYSALTIKRMIWSRG